MNRAGLNQDIEESFLNTKAFELMCWPSYALKGLAAAILAPSLDNKYYLTNDPAVEATKIEYRNFLAEMWAHFCSKRPIDVVLTGNFSYYAEREFGNALEEAGTPFIALHKENFKSPGIAEFWHSVYKERRGEFTGRRILVYNDIERELQISSGVIDAQKVTVTGLPRLDRVHRWRRAHAGPVNGAGRPQILFFAFSSKDYLPEISRKPAAGIPGNMEKITGELGTLSWGGMCEETHRAIVEVARLRPDIDVVVKLKGQARKQAQILAMLSADAESLPPNLNIVTGRDPFHLLTESRVIVGFNTTGLLEAIAAGKPVIVPWFGETCDEVMHDFVIDLGAAVDYAHSPDELIEMTIRYAEQPTEIPCELTPAAARALERWAGNDDGAAGHRVLDAIQGEIKQEKAPR